MEVPIVEILSDVKVAATFLIQFLLGFGLGYFSVRALKYILAFIAILLLGSFLSVWSLGGTLENTLSQLKELGEAARNLLVILGVLTVGPVSVGFIIGAVVALLRK
ncbi:MAG: hypothetical protein NZ925_03835 [Sulfolobales archaeon]|nr:hypothetical protein [Sulfolobales archaeon]MCX8208504.1 hypothetical protein [Sulfolobales archaeon]